MEIGRRGIRGVNVDGRDVQLKAGMCLLEVKAAHAFHISKEGNQLELDADPVAPLAFTQNEFVTLHRESWPPTPADQPQPRMIPSLAAILCGMYCRGR